MDYDYHIMSLPHSRIYLMNTSKHIVIRSAPGRNTKFYAKEKGGKEYLLYHLSDLLQDTLREAKRISRSEYAEF